MPGLQEALWIPAQQTAGMTEVADCGNDGKVRLLECRKGQAAGMKERGDCGDAGFEYFLQFHHK